MLRLKQLAAREQRSMVEWRRRIHERPEIGLHLPDTQDLVAAELETMGLSPMLGQQLSSVAAVIEGDAGGPTVLLRADMDALPLTERSDLPFSSVREGAMHACGHDLHTAMLLGAARILIDRRKELAGKIVLMFQPGEEGYGGAQLMLDEGILQLGGKTPVASYAVHVMAAPWDCGQLLIGEGPILSAADRIDIRLRGKGGHAASPQMASDAISAASSLALQLPSAVQRSKDPMTAGLFNIGAIHSGTAPNIIPAEAELSATLRSFDPKTRDSAFTRIREMCVGVGTSYGLDVNVEITPKYPLTVNNPGLALKARAMLAGLFPDRVSDLEYPVLGAEDFGQVLEQVPGAMVFIGAGVVGHPGWNHADNVVFDETVLADGAAVLSALALSHMTG